MQFLQTLAPVVKGRRGTPFPTYRKRLEASPTSDILWTHGNVKVDAKEMEYGLLWVCSYNAR